MGFLSVVGLATIVSLAAMVLTAMSWNTIRRFMPEESDGQPDLKMMEIAVATCRDLFHEKNNRARAAAECYLLSCFLKANKEVNRGSYDRVLDEVMGALNALKKQADDDTDRAWEEMGTDQAGPHNEPYRANAELGEGELFVDFAKQADAVRSDFQKMMGSSEYTGRSHSSASSSSGPLFNPFSDSTHAPEPEIDSPVSETAVPKYELMTPNVPITETPIPEPVPATPYNDGGPTPEDEHPHRKHPFYGAKVTPPPVANEPF